MCQKEKTELQKAKTFHSPQPVKFRTCSTRKSCYEYNKSRLTNELGLIVRSWKQSSPLSFSLNRVEANEIKRKIRKQSFFPFFPYPLSEYYK